MTAPLGTRGIGAMGPLVRDNLPALVAFALVVVGWEVSFRLLQVPSYLIPRPSEVGAALVTQWGSIQRNVGITFLEASGGFLLGSAVALVLATLFVHSRTLERALYPFAVASYTVPVLAIAPILVILFGSGYTPKVLIAAIISFFPTLVNVTRGLRAVEPSALELMHVLSASRAQVFLKLRVPSSVPFLFAALKIASPASVISAIVAEWIGSDAGLGYLIILATFNFRTDLLYATLVASSILSMAFFGIVFLLERAVVRWRQETLVV
jgi:NitT/TauT family transport system permease protein